MICLEAFAAYSVVRLFSEAEMNRTTLPAEAVSTEDLAGDVAPFSQALGDPEAMASLAALAQWVNWPMPVSTPGVRGFLTRYRDRMLVPVELPVIQKAYNHALRGEVRELAELDRNLRERLGDGAFAMESQRKGRLQLRRLRPMRDRSLQRYLKAVESGEAAGWHLIVFGILLAAFSLPLRQGLAHYAAKNQRGLLEAASGAAALSCEDRETLRLECEGPTAIAIHDLLPGFQPATV
ncbi:MAG: hypothetical protein JNK85_05165 [Verrucomicrobiales bacterium]|nr:hypothetical protein [Verrucomicrobiales bacterium]